MAAGSPQSQRPGRLKKVKLEIPELPDIFLPPVFDPALLQSQNSKALKHQSPKTSQKSPATGVQTSAAENKDSVVSSPRPKKDDLQHAIVSKRTMPKLYSRKHKLDYEISEGVPSLMECCLKVLIAHIDAIDEVGSLPYDVLKPVLEKCTPMQLMRIESHNPHLIEDTDHLWEGFCSREFKNATLRKEEDQGWCEYYVSLCDFRDKKLEHLKAKVTQNLIAAETPKRKTKYTSVVSRPQGRRSNTSLSPVNCSTSSSRASFVPSTSSTSDQPKFSLSRSKSDVTSDPIKRTRVSAVEIPIAIPSRAEILAKRGLKTLTDPNKFQTQTKVVQIAPPSFKVKPVVGIGKNGTPGSTSKVYSQSERGKNKVESSSKASSPLLVEKYIEKRPDVANKASIGSSFKLKSSDERFSSTLKREPSKSDKTIKKLDSKKPVQSLNGPSLAIKRQPLFGGGRKI